MSESVRSLSQESPLNPLSSSLWSALSFTPSTTPLFLSSEVLSVFRFLWLSKKTSVLWSPLFWSTSLPGLCPVASQIPFTSSDSPLSPPLSHLPCYQITLSSWLGSSLGNRLNYGFRCKCSSLIRQEWSSDLASWVTRCGVSQMIWSEASSRWVYGEIPSSQEVLAPWTAACWVELESGEGSCRSKCSGCSTASSPSLQNSLFPPAQAKPTPSAMIESVDAVEASHARPSSRNSFYWFGGSWFERIAWTSPRPQTPLLWSADSSPSTALNLKTLSLALRLSTSVIMVSLYLLAFSWLTSSARRFLRQQRQRHT